MSLQCHWGLPGRLGVRLLLGATVANVFFEWQIPSHVAQRELVPRCLRSVNECNVSSLMIYLKMIVYNVGCNIEAAGDR